MPPTESLVGRLNVRSVVNDLFANADRNFLTSAISLAEGEFLQSFSRRPEVQTTIEVGCGNGVSSLFICDGLDGKTNARHIIIDPFQRVEFGEKGINNLKRAGVSCFDLIEKRSEFALPELLEEGRRFDLGFIDGYHTFDQALVDFYYLDRMLNVNGYIILDDCDAPQLMRLAHYISTYPNYITAGYVGKRGIRRKALNIIKLIFGISTWPVCRLAGDYLSHEFINDSIIHPSRIRAIDNCTMLAFQKTNEYQRPTTWYKHF